MSDATPFLKAILDAPMNNAPRLVYADWLEERGDPHGELIRVQCELARHRIDNPGRRDLELRERRLLNKNALAWFGPLKSLNIKHDPVRGFLPPVRLSAWDALHRHWPDSPLPLRVELDINLAQYPHHEHHLEGLLKSPRLGRVTALRLRIAPATASPDLWSDIHVGSPAVLELQAVLPLVRRVCEFLKAPQRQLLRTLDLSDNVLSTEALAELLDCPHLRGLERLVLRQTGLDDAGLAKLARCPYLTDLASLDLAGNNLADLSPLLDPGALPRLRRLDLWKNRGLSPWMQLELQARFGRRVRF